MMTFVMSYPCLAGQGDGNRHGATRCHFKAFFVPENAAKNRLFLKLDVEEAVSALPEIGSKSRNDDLAGQELTVTVNDQAFVQTVGENGRIKEKTFKMRLNANGRTLHVDLRGLDLVTLLGLDPAQAGKDLTTEANVTITSAVPSDGAGQQVEPNVLWTGTIPFTYKQKAEVKAKGKNW
jgi:hypothetical protein